MPLNEIESHPYLNYLIEKHQGYDNIPWVRYTKMIIGSFPVYSITKTIYPLEENRFQAPEVEMPFFYGSQTNSFWKRLAETFQAENPQLQITPEARKQAAVSLLEDNSVLLTDVIFKSNRYKIEKGRKNLFSPADDALMNKNASLEVVAQFELNNDIIDWLIRSSNICSIYFTAQKAVVGKNPGGWFHSIFSGSNTQLQLLSETSNALRYRFSNPSVKINRDITLFFLPTPSGSRSIAFTALRRNPMFVNYLNSVNPQFCQTLAGQNFVTTQIQGEQLKNYRIEFLKVWWRRFLVEKDWRFEGSLNN